MADEKLSDLSVNTAPDADTLLYLVSDPGGAPVSEATTIGDLRTLFGADQLPAGNLSVTGTSTAGANRAYYQQFRVTRGYSFDQLGAVINISSGNLDLGIYTDSGGQPTTRLVSTGSTASPGTGKRLFTVADTYLAPGLYWRAFATSNTTISLDYSSFGTAGTVGVYDAVTGANTVARHQDTAFPLPSSTGTLANTTIIWTLWLDHS